MREGGRAEFATSLGPPAIPAIARAGPGEPVFSAGAEKAISDRIRTRSETGRNREGDPMADATRRERGLEMIKKVYGGDVVLPPEGTVFTDIMLEQVFAEVWSRDVMSIRDRRLVLLGIIAEKGEAMTFGIQVKAALKNGELEPEEIRELMLMIAQYAGYPRAAGLLGIVEEKIAEVAKEREGA